MAREAPAAALPPELETFHRTGHADVYYFEAQPGRCEFWSAGEIHALNADYEVGTYAPGYLGFATSGGGEMFAIAPDGAVVVLPFIGMEPASALLVAPSWSAFMALLEGGSRGEAVRN